jgi:hypothetical protein
MENQLGGFIYQNGDSKTIVFVDNSVYLDFPDNCTLEIKLPTNDTYLSCLYKPHGITPIGAISLGYSSTSVILPDGIYKVKQSVNPNEFVYREFVFVKLDKINSMLKEQLQSVDIHDKETINRMYKYDVLKQGIEADVCDGRFLEAVQKYELLKTLIKKEECAIAQK